MGVQENRTGDVERGQDEQEPPSVNNNQTRAGDVNQFPSGPADSPGPIQRTLPCPAQWGHGPVHLRPRWGEEAGDGLRHEHGRELWEREPNRWRRDQQRQVP